MDVKERQHVQQPVRAAETPLVGQHGGVAGKVRPREHRALGATGGPGGIDDCRHGVRGVRDAGELRPVPRRKHGERALTLGAERLLAGDACALERGPQQRFIARSDHGKARLRVTQPMLELRRRARGVGGHEHRPQTQARKIEEHRIH